MEVEIVERDRAVLVVDVGHPTVTSYRYIALNKLSGCTKFGLPNFNKDHAISVQR